MEVVEVSSAPGLDISDCLASLEVEVYERKVQTSEASCDPGVLLAVALLIVLDEVLSAGIRCTLLKALNWRAAVAMHTHEHTLSEFSAHGAQVGGLDGQEDESWRENL